MYKGPASLALAVGVIAPIFFFSPLAATFSLTMSLPLSCACLFGSFGSDKVLQTSPLVMDFESLFLGGLCSDIFFPVYAWSAIQQKDRSKAPRGFHVESSDSVHSDREARCDKFVRVGHRVEVVRSAW